jgi:hypothetical protein
MSDSCDLLPPAGMSRFKIIIEYGAKWLVRQQFLCMWNMAANVVIMSKLSNLKSLGHPPAFSL